MIDNLGAASPLGHQNNRGSQSNLQTVVYWWFQHAPQRGKPRSAEAFQTRRERVELPTCCAEPPLPPDGRKHEGPFCPSGALFVKPNPATSSLRLAFPPVARPFSGLTEIHTRDRNFDENLEPGINLLPRGVRGKRHTGLPKPLAKGPKLGKPPTSRRLSQVGRGGIEPPTH